MGGCFIGVDVGTGSARAGVFDAEGRMLGSAKRDITLFREPGSIVEQSSAEIWAAVCAAVRGAVAAAGVGAGRRARHRLRRHLLAGRARAGRRRRCRSGRPRIRPATSSSGWTIAPSIRPSASTPTGHAVLRYVGGTISPEMETPKLLWLKENRAAIFDAAWQFFDLTDFLTWKATGSLARSSCTVTCKWTYLAHERRWDPDYFRGVGLGELADEGFARIGAGGRRPRHRARQRPDRSAAAKALGLAPGTPSPPA